MKEGVVNEAGSPLSSAREHRGGAIPLNPTVIFQTHSKFTLPFVSDPCQLYSPHLFFRLSSTEVIKDRRTKLAESRDFP